jgi:hypothetical protein
VDILTVSPMGEIELPNNTVRERYGMAPATPIRVVETRSGILLVPMSGEPINPELAEELAQWQSLGAESWAMFPYDEEEAQP